MSAHPDGSFVQVPMESAFTQVIAQITVHLKRVVHLGPNISPKTNGVLEENSRIGDRRLFKETNSSH